MTTIQTIFVYLLCALIGSFILSSPLFVLFGFYKLKSKAGKIAVAIGLIGFIAFVLARALV